MSTPRLLHSEARKELFEAFLWYEDRRPGLGQEFLDFFEAALRSGFPLPIPEEQAGGEHPTCRRILMKRFPFTLIVVPLEDEGFFIIAVMHRQRQPSYWLKRTPKGRRRRRRR